MFWCTKNTCLDHSYKHGRKLSYLFVVEHKWSEDTIGSRSATVAPSIVPGVSAYSTSWHGVDALNNLTKDVCMKTIRLITLKYEKKTITSYTLVLVTISYYMYLWGESQQGLEVRLAYCALLITIKLFF